jgi:hypothetical protein
MSMSNIRYLYLENPECTQQCVTVAYRIIEGELYAAFSINKCVIADVAYQEDGYMPYWLVLDRFEKKWGRHISSARLGMENRRFHIPRKEDERSVAAIIKYLARFGAIEEQPVHPRIPQTVGEIALHHLEARMPVEEPGGLSKDHKEEPDLSKAHEEKPDLSKDHKEEPDLVKEAEAE